MNAYAPDPALTSDTSSNRAYIGSEHCDTWRGKPALRPDSLSQHSLIPHLLYNELDEPID